MVTKGQSSAWNLESIDGIVTDQEVSEKQLPAIGTKSACYLKVTYKDSVSGGSGGPFGGASGEASLALSSSCRCLAL